MSENTFTKADYNELMAKIDEGGKVSRKTFDEMITFAKAKKIKRPSEDAVLDEASIKAAKKDSGEKKAATKEPKVKAKCSVTKAEDPKMTTKTCPNDSRSNGMCATHYSRLVYRAKPENAEKARQASKAYAARIREEKAASKEKAGAAA